MFVPVARTCNACVPVGVIETESEPSVLVVTAAVALPAPIAVFSAVWIAVCSAAAPPAPDQSAPATDTVLTAPPSSATPNCNVPAALMSRAVDAIEPPIELIAPFT